MTEPIISAEFDSSEVQSLIAKLSKAGRLRSAFVDIGEEALLQFDEGFETETDPYGIAWAPLSQATINWKKENSRILKILQSTGRMRASISYQADDDRVVVGSNVKYAKKNQKTRPFMGVGIKLKTAIVEILQDHVLDLEN